MRLLELIQGDAEMRSTPFAFVSSTAEPDEFGSSLVIRRPVDPDAMLTTVMSLLARTDDAEASSPNTRADQGSE
jgi:hypothetical protein